MQCYPLEAPFTSSTEQDYLTTQCRFNQQILVDTTPMPDHIPKVDEIGATSAPLTSAAYFIGDRCKAFNDDYMKCKVESNGRGELECLKEGRKVTRCAASVYVSNLLDLTGGRIEAQHDVVYTWAGRKDGRIADTH